MKKGFASYRLITTCSGFSKSDTFLEISNACNDIDELETQYKSQSHHDDTSIKTLAKNRAKKLSKSCSNDSDTYICEKVLNEFTGPGCITALANHSNVLGLFDEFDDDRARLSKNSNLSSSYYKQLPAYSEKSNSHMNELQCLGINFHDYKNNYETSTLPKNMYFNSAGIELISDDEWIQYYHTLFNDSLAKSMIEHRLKIGQTIEFDGRFGLNNSYTSDIMYECQEKTTNESHKQQVEKNLDNNNTTHNIISNQSNVLPVTTSDIPFHLINNVDDSQELILIK
ncbi:unnamed protein product [Adineta steineri]|uniref:Uncharacterized protein n=1 Tax=Adineta steineri TaxID=433720 RepID=A0A813Y5M5_9BILA|nr:unnamed protein product [Adineta steineri]CAF3917192.1 unnamed protein product [Adineta steineri]